MADAGRRQLTPETLCRLRLRALGLRRRPRWLANARPAAVTERRLLADSRGGRTHASAWQGPRSARVGATEATRRSCARALQPQAAIGRLKHANLCCACG